jgi:redox-sensitive bicupin YhaK (pirin superfamily)
MSQSILHKANTRGAVDHGWLQSHHTFSFADYYDEARMNFGVLRVLNDDTIAGGTGFGTHGHSDMEIITIPLSGSLAHKDSLDNSETIHTGEIQVMSAGTGVRHSEYNADKSIPVSLLQIWIMPNRERITPRYQQITLRYEDKQNKLQQILSPHETEGEVWIHQNAWFHLGHFDKDISTVYELKDKINNGLYIFVIKGDVKVNDQELSTRDGYGVWDTDTVTITTLSDCEFLLMEVPMN